MSRCPDAFLCERVWDDVLKKVASKVDLKLVYVAKLVLFPFLLARQASDLD